MLENRHKSASSDAHIKIADIPSTIFSTVRVTKLSREDLLKNQYRRRSVKTVQSVGTNRESRRAVTNTRSANNKSVDYNDDSISTVRNTHYHQNQSTELPLDKKTATWGENMTRSASVFTDHPHNCSSVRLSPNKWNNDDLNESLPIQKMNNDQEYDFNIFSSIKKQPSAQTKLPGFPNIISGIHNGIMSSHDMQSKRIFYVNENDQNSNMKKRRKRKDDCHCSCLCILISLLVVFIIGATIIATTVALTIKHQTTTTTIKTTTVTPETTTTTTTVITTTVTTETTTTITTETTTTVTTETTTTTTTTETTTTTTTSVTTETTTTETTSTTSSTTTESTTTPYSCGNMTILFNTDLVGFDIGSASGTTWIACCALCLSNTNCQSFTWLIASDNCYLKTTPTNNGSYSTTHLSAKY